MESLRRTAIGANFVVIRTDYLEHGPVPEGQENPSQVIVDFCELGFLYKALSLDPRIGMLLPFRVWIAQTDQGVFVMFERWQSDVESILA